MISLTCANCGNGFRRYPSHVKEGPNFCSDRCARTATRRGSLLECARCKVRFYRAASEIARNDSRFCSRDCYMADRAENRKSNTYVKVGQKHEHRVVAERILGRPLLSRERVHHIDEDKHNNDPSNLAVFPSQSDHARCHSGAMDEAELNACRLLTLAAAIHA